MKFVTLAAAALGLALCFPAAAVRAQDFKAILAQPDRATPDVENDKKRDALKLLEFTGVKTGMTVLDMGAGGGYSTELMARAVGPTGKVYGQNEKESERFINRMKATPVKNITSLARPFDDPLPADVKNLDLITFFFYYHDTTYMDVDPRRDHSIRVPRPSMSVKIGTPNACTRCHLDRDGSLGKIADEKRASLKQYADWLRLAPRDESIRADTSLDRLAGLAPVVDPWEYNITSPPTVVGDVVIIGSSIADTLRRVAPPEE